MCITDSNLYRYIDKQVERGASFSNTTDSDPVPYTDLIREDDADKITFNVSTCTDTSSTHSDIKLTNPLKETKSAEDVHRHKRNSSSSESSKSKKKQRMSSLDEVKLMENRKREKENRKDYWLHEGIVVKITTKRLGDKYFNKKGVVTEVVDNYSGMIRIIGADIVLKLDQTFLETVIPNIGKYVLIVNGAYRGNKAKLVCCNTDTFNVDLELCEGLLMGKPILSCEYEDVCKLFNSE